MERKSSMRIALTLSAFTAIVVQVPAQAATCTPQWSSSSSTNTTNLQNAINKCVGTSGSPGLIDLTTNNGVSTAVITTVNLASNIVLKIESGFTLKGSPSQPSSGAMLVGNNVSNVTITGTGAIERRRPDILVGRSRPG